MNAAALMAKFEPFSFMHALVVATVALAGVTLVTFGRRARDNNGGPLCDKILARLCAVAWTLPFIYDLTPRRLSWAESLPLHVCDLVGLVVPLMLLRPHRLARTIVHFWGIAVCTQAFITPVLRDGMGHFTFWQYWLSHAAILLAAAYDAAVRGYRPAWRDCGLAIASGLIYVALALPIDVLLNANYGYVGASTHHKRTLIKLLGPWPGRVGWIILLFCAVLTIQMTLWSASRWIGRELGGWRDALAGLGPRLRARDNRVTSS